MIPVKRRTRGLLNVRQTEPERLAFGAAHRLPGRTPHYALIAILLMASLIGCGGSPRHGDLSQPADARIDIPAEPLAAFDPESRSTLFRYLAGNPRWEIRQERGLKYAVRREMVDGEYETTLNGFYSTRQGESFRQTRVLIAFEGSYGFGREHGNVTRVRAGSDDVPVTIEASHTGVPGNSSYVIIEGDQLSLEIYEQAPAVKRHFTQAAMADVFAELADVLKYRDEITTTGVMPVASRYPGKRPDAADFTVSDGMQPGMYLLSAAVNPRTPGYVYAKVFDATSGQRLSEARLTPASTRYVGWSDSGQTFFPYNAEVTVYEGDWSSQYSARFELWHKPEQGQESKVAETTRMINGWQR